MTLKPIDYDTLTPGIREFVRELREVHGLETTDSGDGVTNVALGMEGALEERHVYIAVELDEMVEVTEWLAELYPDAWVECSYSPGQSPSIVICPDGLVLPEGVTEVEPIQTKEEHAEALREVEQLVALDPAPGTPEHGRMVILVSLLTAYEERAFPLVDVE